MKKKENLRKIAEIIFEVFGEDKNREGLKETPRRIEDAYKQILSGYAVKDPSSILKPIYKKETYSEIILVKDIPFYSLCEHHILPFFGKASVAYIPKNSMILGLSKIPRLVEVYARRLQIQERLTGQIADTLYKTIEPLGVMVIMEAEHLCMTMRGVQKPGTKMITSALRGIFMKDAKVRAEAMSLMKNG